MILYHQNDHKELIRRKIITAGTLVLTNPTNASLTVQDVCFEAGVTEREFLHHFSDERALPLAIFDDFISSVERDLDRYIIEDPEEYGSFTRAYTEFLIESAWRGKLDRRSALVALCFNDPELQPMWVNWFDNILRKHLHTDGDDHLSVARFAAEKFCLSALSSVNPPDIGETREILLDVTHKKC